MKVLHVIPSIASVRGGPSQAILEMVLALRNIDVNAEIITTNDNGDNLLNVPLGEKTLYQQVPVRFFSRFSPSLTTIKEFAFSWQLTLWLWNNIDSYDLLHVHAIFSYSSTIAMKIARIKNIPYICRPIGQLCSWSLEQSKYQKKFYFNLIECANLNNSQALHFTSFQEQQEALSLNLKSNSFILPHGVSIIPKITNAQQKLRQQFNLPANQPIILFLSRIHPKKGLDYLIPALGRLTDVDFTFILAGNGELEYEEKVTQLLRQNHLKDKTIQVGFVQGEAKKLLLQGSDLFVLTSHSENFGVAVLEALAAGTPALVTPGVALSILIQEQQVGYITDLAIDSIAKSLEYCLSHHKELAIQGEQARNLVIQNYGWNAIAKHLNENYKKIIKNQE